MHTYRKIRNALTLIGLLALSLVACTGASPAAALPTTAPVSTATSVVQEVAPTAVPPTTEEEAAAPATATAAADTDDGTGADAGGQAAQATVAPSPTPATDTQVAAAAVALSDAEVEGLLYMHEEEKLAHDVYRALYEVWGLNVFANIADSEATHVAAVAELLDHYGVTPVAAPEAGVYTDPTLQELYGQLVDSGTQSLEDALRVGGAIEEIDILDLREYVAETDRADIQRVYENLTRGSENHLRAFVSNLERRTGETYVPQYLDAAAYQTIAGTEVARGNGRR